MTQSNRAAVFSFLERTFVALAKLCLRLGVKVQEAEEQLKVGFVKAARSELEKGNEKVTVSKVAIMTGLHRRDVTRLLSDEETPTDDTRLLARILHRWAHEKQFSVKGKPKMLSMIGAQGDFVDLVHGVSKELSPYTVLFELERIGAVEREGTNLRLKSSVFGNSKDVERVLGMFGADLADLVGTAEHNIFREREAPQHHLRSEFDNIPSSFLPELRKRILEIGAEVHAKVAQLLAAHDCDEQPKLQAAGERSRVKFVSFSVEEISEKQSKVDKSKS